MKTPDSTDCARSEKLGSPIVRAFLRYERKRAALAESAARDGGYFVISVAPGAATLFGQIVTQRPFCTCFTAIRSSP